MTYLIIGVSVLAIWVLGAVLTAWWVMNGGDDDANSG